MSGVISFLRWAQCSQKRLKRGTVLFKKFVLSLSRSVAWHSVKKPKTIIRKNMKTCRIYFFIILFRFCRMSFKNLNKTPFAELLSFFFFFWFFGIFYFLSFWLVASFGLSSLSFWNILRVVWHIPPLYWLKFVICNFLYLKQNYEKHLIHIHLGCSGVIFGFWLNLFNGTCKQNRTCYDVYVNDMFQKKQNSLLMD